VDNQLSEYTIEYPRVIDLLQDTRLSFIDPTKLSGIPRMAEQESKIARKKCIETFITDWGDYENDEKSLTQEDFYKFFLANKSSDIEAILFTFEGLMQKTAFRFRISDFFKFSSLYEDHFSMEFFQLSYYIILFPMINVYTYINADGKIVECTISP
jgi:hypothetical protein